MCVWQSHRRDERMSKETRNKINITRWGSKCPKLVPSGYFFYNVPVSGIFSTVVFFISIFTMHSFLFLNVNVVNIFFFRTFATKGKSPCPVIFRSSRPGGVVQRCSESQEVLLVLLSYYKFDFTSCYNPRWTLGG